MTVYRDLSLLAAAAAATVVLLGDGAHAKTLLQTGQDTATDCGVGSAEIGRWTGSDCAYDELIVNTIGECDVACTEASAVGCDWIDTDSECRNYTLVDPDDPELDDCKIEDDDDDKILHMSWLVCAADGDAPAPGPASCDCSDEEDAPVCSVTSGITYPNMCEAICENDGMNVRDGECPENDGGGNGGYGGMYGGYGGYGGSYGGNDGSAGINFRDSMNAGYGQNGGNYGGMYGRNGGYGGTDGGNNGRGGINFRDAMNAGYGQYGGNYGGMYGGYGGPRGGYGRYGQGGPGSRKLKM